MKDQRWAVISDIHLGHKQNSCQKMVDALNEAIIFSGLIKRIQVLVLAGDVFERLLELNHPDIPIIDLWIAGLLQVCRTNNVALRVLNGTESHDRNQSERFETIRQILGLDDMNYKYIHDMEVEYMANLDTHVLYIRDRGEGRPAQETYTEALEHMRAKGVHKVDVAVMHGMFEYQMPMGQSQYEGVHCQAQYEAIVNANIYIGHVHTHSRNGKVVAQGSFDRLKHSEEEPKGFVECEYINGVPHVHFIENKQARHYRNIYTYGMNVEETIAHVDEHVKDLNPDACVCIEAEKSHPIFTNMAELTLRYPTFTWSKRPKDKNTQALNEVEPETDLIEWHPIHVSATNIEEIMMKRVAAHGLSEQDHNFIRSKIQELK